MVPHKASLNSKEFNLCRPVRKVGLGTNVKRPTIRKENINTKIIVAKIYK